MFAKIDVNGPAAHPLYQYLKESRPGLFGSERIKWNFTKFLVDRTGKVVNRFAPSTKPAGDRRPHRRVVEQLSVAIAPNQENTQRACAEAFP